MIHIVQYLCPQRHCIVAALYDPSTTTREATIEAMKAGMAKMKLNPWCHLCGSGELHFEDARSQFATLEQAIPAAKMMEMYNLLTRAIHDLNAAIPSVNEGESRCE